MMRWASTAIAAAATLFGVASPFAAAMVQAPQPAPAPSAGGLFSNTGGPIDFGADGAERFQQDGRTVYTGNVDVVQGQSRLRTPKLTVFSAKPPPGPKANAAGPGGDLGAVERVEAEGPVYYVTPTQQVKGDHGTYIAANDTITVTGNVTLLQGQDVLHGDKLVIEQKTGHSTLTTDRPGKGPQRVRGVFFPKESNTTGASGAAPPQPPKTGA